MRGFGATAADASVQSCIQDLRNQLTAFGFLKASAAGPLADALFIGAVAALAGTDVAAKLANTSGTADSIARLQACDIVRQIIAKKTGVAPPPPPGSPGSTAYVPPPAAEPSTPMGQIVGFGIGALLAAGGVLLAL